MYLLNGIMNGEIGMRSKNNLVYEVGINDANYNVTLSEKVDGKWEIIYQCPYYRTWTHMLERCYSDKYHERKPTYRECTVCEEWLTFSNFRKWMEQQDWENNQLDKDLLWFGNKEYNPNNCVFIPQIVNSFLTDRGNGRGEYPIGVSFHKKTRKFRAMCCNPFTKRQEHLGLFNGTDQAHSAWKERKHALACQLADSEYVTDERVAHALRTRFL
mgnify:CR=1 FL=1